MAKLPFEAYSPDFRPLLDKLPAPDERGEFSLEGHWLRTECDKIAEAIAAASKPILGDGPRLCMSNIFKARSSPVLSALRRKP